MDVTLSFNSKNYILKLHEVDLWTHQATMNDNEMTQFIIEVLKNNLAIKEEVIKNV